ncbi:MAG TPA: family 10 glycosylhydrolase [Candidatus Brocadiia bacterium]|nr:family 10 glycosylhydrolase [Candidatus Brocadiia bacterium]
MNCACRSCIGCAALAICAIFTISASADENPGKPETRPAILSSPVTHSDWMLRNPPPKWGPEGVRQILDRCKQCGWKRVYWRCFDGGKALYPSKLLEPAHGYDEENYHRDHGTAWVLEKLKDLDWGSYDALREAVTYGHQIGIEVHAWLSINEDDHGYGLTSRFSREHPQFRWMRRDGSAFRTQLSFAFKEVRDYKLALVEEILSYDPDGILFDWIRTGDVRDNPHTDSGGAANYGYEIPNIEAFRKAYGIDPKDVPNGDEHWVRVRAEPQTVFMRDARKLIRLKNPRAKVAALVHNPWGYRGSPTDTPYDGNLRGLLLDTGKWAEEGLIDEAVAAGYYRPGGSPEAAYNALVKETGGKVRVWLFGWLGGKDQFLGDVSLAEKLGAPQILLWESDYVALAPANEEVVRAMNDYSTGKGDQTK